MMHACDRDRRIQKAEDGSAKESKCRIQPGQSEREQIAGLTKDRANKQEGQRSRDQDRKKRGGQVVEPAWRHFMQTFFDIGKDP